MSICVKVTLGGMFDLIVPSASCALTFRCAAKPNAIHPQRTRPIRFVIFAIAESWAS
jgi:hypothetical protein